MNDKFTAITKQQQQNNNEFNDDYGIWMENVYYYLISKDLNTSSSSQSLNI